MGCNHKKKSGRSGIVGRALAGITLGLSTHVVCPCHTIPILVSTGIISGGTATRLSALHDYIVHDVVEPVVSFVRGEDESGYLSGHSQFEHHDSGQYNPRNERMLINIFDNAAWGDSPTLDYLTRQKPRIPVLEDHHCDHEYCGLTPHASENERIAEEIVHKTTLTATFGIPAAIIGIPLYRNRRRRNG